MTAALGWPFYFPLADTDVLRCPREFAWFSDAQGLAWARTKADQARSRVEEGDHLTRVKAAKKATERAASANTFAVVAEHWLKSEARRARWTPD